MNQSLLIAILSTIAMVFSGIFAGLKPAPLKLVAFAGFTIAATLNWVKYSSRD